MRRGGEKAAVAVGSSGRGAFSEPLQSFAASRGSLVLHAQTSCCSGCPGCSAAFTVQQDELSTSTNELAQQHKGLAINMARKAATMEWRNDKGVRRICQQDHPILGGFIKYLNHRRRIPGYACSCELPVAHVRASTDLPAQDRQWEDCALINFFCTKRENRWVLAGCKFR